MWQYWRGIFAPHASFFLTECDLSVVQEEIPTGRPPVPPFSYAPPFGLMCAPEKWPRVTGAAVKLLHFGSHWTVLPPSSSHLLFIFITIFFAAPPAAVRLFFRTKSHSCFYTFLAARRKYFQPETRRIVKSNLKIFSFFSNNKFINLKSVEWTTLFKTRCAHRLNLNGFYRPLSRKGEG